MGVHGLWRLIEPSGKTVPVETLENKVLAVDVSIWLHQAVKGFQDSKGQPLPNAHLLGIYHRVCKLLYFRIKPVFVFDGGVPALKKQTIAKRNQQKAKNFNATGRIHKQLLSTLLKHSAVNKVLSEKAKADLEAASIEQKKDVDENLFVLPPQIDSESEEECEYDSESTLESDSPTKNLDIHTIDMESVHFRSLPADVRHEILTEVKETRKQSSWGRLHELPTKSDDFAVFQLNRLRKRYQVQVSIEEAEKEMGGHSLSLVQLEKLLNDQGVITKNLEIGSRIASDENARFLLIKDVKKAVETAKQEIEGMESKQKDKADLEYENEIQKAIELSKVSADGNCHSSLTSADVNTECDEELQKAIQLSLECEPSSSTHQDSFNVTLDDDFMSSSSSDSDENNVLTSAKNYMMEYSGLTPTEIAKIIGKQTKTKISAKSDVKMNVESSEKPTSLPTERKLSVIHEAVSENADIMSNSDSESSGNFEEVAAVESGLEIVIKPSDTLDDDLFSDIFDNKEEAECTESVTSTVQNIEESSSAGASIEIRELEKPIDSVESTVPVDLAQKPAKDTELIISLSSPPKHRNEVIIEREKTINVIRGMLKGVKDKQLEGDTTGSKDAVKVSLEELKEIQTNLSQESRELRAEKSTKERLASDITDQMYQEAQELLELFGVPYITAPMEAEAQCAFLDAIGLTDGTITDDSDIWLFGGKTVYKNFFNQSKRVMEFNAENIQHCFKLTREQMVLLALLVGSDYTTGIQGIGPVTALEILAAFPSNTKQTEFQVSHPQLLSGLSEFRKWYIGSTKKGPSRISLRRKLKNLELSDNFPSLQVVQAYLDPQVETSREAFSWGKPDVVGLIDFAKQKFGWNKTKSEEILKPVLKRLEERHAQTSLLDYFKTKHKISSGEYEKHMSKRVKKALDKIGKGSDEDSGDEKTSRNKQTSKTMKSGKAKSKRKKENEQVEGEKCVSKRVRKVDENSGDEKKSKVKETTKKAEVRAAESVKKEEAERVEDEKYMSEGVQTAMEAAGTSDEKIKGESKTRKVKTADVKSKQKRKTELDEDIKILKQTTVRSRRRLAEIEEAAKEKALQEKARKTRISSTLHTKEIIVQKEMDKKSLLKNKMKAIEVFRKSKQGPGYMKKRKKVVLQPKEDAELSESSSSD